MKITSIETGLLRAPLRTPFVTALRRADSIEDVVVILHTDTQEKGFGEAPPTGVITGDTRGAIEGAIRDHIAPKLIGADLNSFNDLLEAVQKSCVHNTSAKAAVDMALYDLYGKMLGLPVYRMLGGGRTSLETDLTISVNDPETMAKDALAAKKRGFKVLKMKAGIDPSLDVERLSAVRGAVGEEMTIRIDANQAWKPKEAVRILNRMQERGLAIELVEQPVPAADLPGLTYVTQHSYVPVMADEAVFSPSDALKIMQMHAADYINIKLMKCGGLSQALKLTALAEIYGMECMTGCMLEAKIAVNAAVELACARKVITKVDLDGPGLCSYDPVEGGAQFLDKDIIVSQDPGLGITGIETGYYTKLDSLS